MSSLCPYDINILYKKFYEYDPLSIIDSFMNKAPWNIIRLSHSNRYMSLKIIYIPVYLHKMYIDNKTINILLLFWPFVLRKSLTLSVSSILIFNYMKGGFYEGHFISICIKIAFARQNLKRITFFVESSDAIFFLFGLSPIVN